MSYANSLAEIYGDFDANFLEDSITELLKSRQILKGSYPYGYFLENERGQRTIFESMQVNIYPQCPF